MRCPYKVLGVSETATSAQIQSAYHKLALTFHPDKSDGNVIVCEYFKLINEAYNTLKTKSARERYDKSKQEDNLMNEFFNDLFYDNICRQNFINSKGRNILLLCGVSLQQIYTGDKIALKHKTLIECPDCNSRGTLYTMHSTNCVKCNGLGIIKKRYGFMVLNQSCLSCKGSGLVNYAKCPKCNSSGRIVGNREINAVIPRGAEDEHTTILKRMGEAGLNGGPCGNLYLRAIVLEHMFYARYKLNLLCVAPVKPATALLGGRITIKGLTGNSMVLNIPRLS